jgi:putative inorganic carbon (hco3(-)) transporter
VPGLLLAALVAVPPVWFWRGLDSAFAAPKLLLLALLTTALLVVRRSPSSRPDAPAVPWPPALVASLLVLGLVAVATLTSDVPALSVIGHHGRFSGLVAYTIGALLLVRVATTREQDDLELLVPGLAIGAGLVSLYGAFQRLGLDPLEWTYAVDITGSASTLGNPNFASAHAAIGVAVGTGILLARPVRAWRIAGWVLVVLSVAGCLAANSVQGYLAAVAGAITAVVAWAIRRQPERQLALSVGAAGVAAVGAVAVGAGAAGLGPLAVIANRASTQVRIWDWRTALAIGGDHPLGGVGFDRFSGYAYTYRPAEAADLLGPETLLDTPHNVPLSMLVGGGVPLLLVYLALLAVTAWALVVGLGRLEGRRHQLLGTLGAAWAAYQVQSMVSIDVPSLLATHWILAGAIVALTYPAGARRVPGLTTERWQHARVPVTIVGGLVVAAVLLVPTGRLIAAEAAAGRGQSAFAAGDAATAVEAAEQAVARGGWEPRYGELLAFARGEAGDGPGALEALLDATAADPRALSPQLNTARLAAALGETQLAAERYRVVVALEPHHVGVHAEAAEAVAAAEGHAAAVALLDELVERRPASAEARDLRDRVAATG